MVDTASARVGRLLSEPARPDEARVASLQVGRPRTLGRPEAEDAQERPWTSAIWKTPVSGPRAVSTHNIEGDAQADLSVHGGPDKAVLAYALAHYPYWRKELPAVDFPPGSFGENLTVEGATEVDVAVGDTWRVGSALLQVSQPRQPCWKLARHLNVRDMVVRVHESGRTGWYYRVLEEGAVEAGSEMVLLDRPHSEWTVAIATEVMLDIAAGPEAALELASVPELSESWKRILRLRADGASGDTAARTDPPVVDS